MNGIVLLIYSLRKTQGSRGIHVKKSITFNGIIWIAHNGERRDMPEQYGPWKTIYSRFPKWIGGGILDYIFRNLSLEAESEKLSLDSSIVQAHQHRAGAKKGALQ